MKKIVLIIFAIVILFLIGNKSISEEIIIPNESIRIRVIANSNSIKDQNLKKRVKKSIQKDLTEMLKDSKNIDEVRNILNEKLEGIKYTVESEITKESERNQDFNINYGYNYFPEKVYKGVTYREGYYESLVVKIGEGQGDNWWCVLFPPLCLMDEEEDNIDEAEYKSFVKEIIDKLF